MRDREPRRRLSKARPAPIADGIAVEAQTKGINDDPEFVQLLLFVERGWLESLEIVYFQDYIPDEFPSPNSFEPPFTPKMRHSESL